MNSYWISSTNCLNELNVPELDNNYTADVCIIGAGLVGLSTAYYLSKKGLNVIVLDKNGIGKKTSGHTTAKITLQHGLIYDYLINSFGVDFALKYFESNKIAISNIKHIIENEHIDCDFEYTDNYIYTTNQDDLIKINKEIDAINRLARI